MICFTNRMTHALNNIVCVCVHVWLALPYWVCIHDGMDAHRRSEESSAAQTRAPQQQQQQKHTALNFDISIGCVRCGPQQSGKAINLQW